MTETDDYKLSAISRLESLSRMLRSGSTLAGDEKLQKLVNKKLTALINSLDVPNAAPLR